MITVHVRYDRILSATLQICKVAVLFLGLRLCAETAVYPTALNKKGLQVQMVDDALVLGVQHAGLNVNLCSLWQPAPGPGSILFTNKGKVHAFSLPAVQGLDGTVKALSDHGVLISLIILAYESGDPLANRALLHPKYDKACPNHLGAFNTVTEEGQAAYQACLAFLAARYHGGTPQSGRVVNYIIGNEVNSHWFWSNRGRVSMEEFAVDYSMAIRLAQQAVAQYDPVARVFVSLEHHWNIHYPGGDTQQTFPARPFLELLAKLIREKGDIPWHVAFHPYPENLFEPRFWNDASATTNKDTPRITFKNLELLVDFLGQPQMTFQGKPRRIILSEQGFHAKPGAEGELNQAAAYALAYKRVAAMEGIDSFILHRHVDHSAEGGLNLGLWERKENSVADPGRRRKMYEVFKAAGTPAEEETFRFALPLIGITNWPTASALK